jgi:hypothetical protein
MPFRVTDASQLDAAGPVLRTEIEDLVGAREVPCAIDELVGGGVHRGDLSGREQLAHAHETVSLVGRDRIGVECHGTFLLIAT